MSLSTIVQGGHAIMMRVTLEPQAQTALDKFVSLHHERHIKGDLHLTLAFVGRDLTKQNKDAIRDITSELATSVPYKLRLTGFEKFGRDKDHVVMLVEKSVRLMLIRIWVEAKLIEMGVVLSKRWKPHVTLCVMEQESKLPIINMITDEQVNGLVAASFGTEVTIKSLIAKTGKDMKEYKVTYT